jgi:hypothetical protein
MMLKRFTDERKSVIPFMGFFKCRGKTNDKIVSKKKGLSIGLHRLAYAPNRKFILGFPIGYIILQCLKT